MVRLKASSTNRDALVNSITSVIKKDGMVEVVSIGAASLNEATKAMIHAKSKLASMGYMISCTPAFIKVQIEDEGAASGQEEIIEQGEQSEEDKPITRTAIRWLIKGSPEY